VYHSTWVNSSEKVVHNKKDGDFFSKLERGRRRDAGAREIKKLKGVCAGSIWTGEESSEDRVPGRKSLAGRGDIVEGDETICANSRSPSG